MSNTRKLWWILIAAIFLIGVGLSVFVGSRVTGPDRPSDGRRWIVSLAPSVTEILFALDRGGTLVGATDHCDYPPEALSIERVGGFGSPNVEKLLALSPDLVIAAGLEREEVAEVLRRSGIRVLDVQIGDFEEMFAAIRQIGDAVNAPEKAKGPYCADAGRT